MKTMITAVLLTTLLLLSNGGSWAQTDAGTLDPADVARDVPDYSPFVDRHVPDRVLWGDTHLHTSYSMDAGFFGNTLDPEQAYRFARGEEVVSSTGERVKLIRPLDFLVVADHALYFGLADALAKGDPSVLADPVGARWYKMRRGTPEEGMQAFYEVVESASTRNLLIKNPAVLRSAWDRSVGFSSSTTIPESSLHSSALSGRLFRTATTCTGS